MKTKKMLFAFIVATLLILIIPNTSGTLAGHFTLVEQKDDGDNYMGVYSDNQFIYVACGTDGLRIYNKTSRDLLTSIYDAGIYMDVQSYGKFIFVSCEGAGLLCYWFNYIDDLNYDLTLNDTSYDIVFDSYMTVHVEQTGTYVFTGCQSEGILAYTYDSITGALTNVGIQYDGINDYLGISSDSTYIYVACRYEGIRAYSFDGATFTLEDTAYDGTESYYDVMVEPSETYIYTASGINGTYVYTFVGGAFNLQYNAYDGTGGNNYQNIWCNDTLIYFACESEGIRCYTSYDGIDMTLLDTEAPAGTSCYAVGGDDTYIYYSALSDGIYYYTFDITGSGIITLPTVTTIDPPTGIGLNNATLPGVLTNDGGETCSVWFQYGTTYPYSHSSVHQTKTTGQSFNINIIGLTQNTTYSYRAVAQNSNGTTYGANQSFTTLSSSGVQVNWTGIFDSIGRMFTGGEYYDSNGVHHSVTGIFGGGQDTRALLGVFIFAILFLLTTIWGLGILIGSVAIIPSVFAVMNYIPELGIIVAIVAGLLFGLGLNRIVRR